VADWFEAATAQDECGALARAVRWDLTPLGDPETWPAALRSAVELCFSTRFPVMLAWGPELTMIYNDGYRPMLGTEKHPAAMGSAAKAVWGEIWGDIEPSFRQVLETGVPTWEVDLPLRVERSGFVEETSFSFSYSPLRDEHGAVVGVLDIATETTEQVVSARRLATLTALSTALAATPGGADDQVRIALAALGASVDVAYACVRLRDAEGLRVVGRHGEPSDDIPLAVLDAVADRGGTTILGSTVVAALSDTRDDEAAGVVVLEASARRPFDAGNREFLQLMTSTIGAAVTATLRRLRELDEVATVSRALQEAMLPSPSSLDGAAVRYRPADGRLSVGGDWFDLVDLSDGRRGLVVGDCVGHGLEAAAVMGQLRSAARALLLENGSPATTLLGLDRYARTLPGAEFTTVFCGVLDPAAGTLTHATAGHLPPALITADGADWLREARSTPLGLTVGAGERREAVAAVSASDLVLLYTDGLVERRDSTLRIGLQRLLDLAPGLRDGSLDDAVDGLLGQMLTADVRDDVVVLLCRV